MSCLKPIGTPYVLAGEKFNLVFNLNALHAIYEKYGSATAFTNEFNAAMSDTNNQLKAVNILKWVLCVLVNDAIEEKNEQSKEKMDLLTEHQIGRLLRPKDFVPLQGAILSAWKEANGDEETCDSDVDQDEDGDTEKN